MKIRQGSLARGDYLEIETGTGKDSHETKTIIPLVLGVCVGGVAIKLVVDVVNKAQGASEASMSQCVVAKMDIGFAEEITPDKLMLKDWPEDSLPEEYFENVEDLQNRVTSMFIPKDVPVYPSMLASVGTPPGIQTRIQPGYRAVSVGIDEITGVAYQLQPGDRVDIISLVQRTRLGRSDVISRVILQNVEIAAVGRALHTGKPGDAPKSVARSVTLLLKPEEVTKLHLAQSVRGKISLALRGNTDEHIDGHLAEATNEALLGFESRDDAQPEPHETLPSLEPVKSETRHPASWTVTVINGNDIRMVEYKHINGRWVQGDEAMRSSMNRFPDSPGGDSGLQPANEKG